MFLTLTQSDLYAAWTQVSRKSRIAGVDGVTVDDFATVRDEQLARLHRQLERETYSPQPAKGIYLPKINGGKRLIGIPTVKDRIIQRMLLEELYLPLEEIFLDCSYAYRPGRGIQKAVKHFYIYYQVQPCWVIKADIEKFFDNICWAILLTKLEQLDLEPIFLRLIEQQIKAGIKIKHHLSYPDKGILQGSILSGALANLYLSEFDRTCLNQGINLIRYGDDFVIACPSEANAQKTLALVEELLGELLLKLQIKKTKIVSPGHSFEFLGYKFHRGKVYEPPPPPPGETRLLPSGTPTPPRKVFTPKFISRPPKVCSLVNSANEPVPTSLLHYFSEQMTTLYVTDQGAYLKAKQYQFQVFYKHKLRCKIPVNRVTNIVLFGCCNMSHGAVKLALSRRIPVMYLSYRGRYFGRLQSEGQAKVEYLNFQVKNSFNPTFVRIQAKKIVLAKLQNSRVLLMRLNRRQKKKTTAKAIDEIGKLMKKLPQAKTLEAIRGYEGKAAVYYFRGLGCLFTESFTISERNRRPPKDPVNSLLSLGYTLLSQNVFSLIQAVGLHTHFGNLHTTRDNHPALVLDLMEEFRAQVVDSLIAYLVNKKIITIDDFTPPDERGGVYLYPDALKKFLKHWEEKLQSELTHPHTKFKVTLLRCMELQVREYAAFITGETEAYRPMLWVK